jgi:glutathione S-transferase
MRVVRYKLYHCPLTRSARVKWLLHEIFDEAFDVELVPLYSGVQYGPEFLRMNPNHNVPVLEISWDDGSKTTMLESAAMVAMLADAHPEAELAPPAGAATPARADYLQMLHFGGSWMDMMLWQIRAHEHLLGEADFDQRTIDRYRKKFMREVEPQLLRRFENGGFICGEAFSAADCVIGHNVNWARAYGLCADDVFGGYVMRLAGRKAFQQAFADASGFSVAPPGGRPERTRFTG